MKPWPMELDQPVMWLERYYTPFTELSENLFCFVLTGKRKVPYWMSTKGMEVIIHNHKDKAICAAELDLYIKVFEYQSLHRHSRLQPTTASSSINDTSEAMESRVAVLLLAVLPMVLAVPYWEDRAIAYGGYPDSGRIQKADGFPNNDVYQSEGGLSVGRIQQQSPKVEYVFTETGPFRYDNIRNTVSSPSLPCSADYYFDNGRMFVRITLAGMFEVSSVSVRVQGHNDGRYENFMSPTVLLKNQNRQITYSQTGSDQESGENVQITVYPISSATVIEAQIWQRGYGCPWDIVFSFIC